MVSHAAKDISNSPAYPYSGELGSESSRDIERGDELVFPQQKRVFARYVTDPQGELEYRLSFADQEISFDEAELFPFGEALGRNGRFAAEDVLSWGAGSDWPRLGKLLGQLIAEGVLIRAEDYQPEPPPPNGRACPSPLPPASASRSRTWLECDAISRELTGRPLALTHLETVIPVYRIAHMYLDTDGRQVGEANVFPSRMRLDVPTDWRVCPHPGSRYRHAQPMNVSALKAMRVHWNDTLALAARIRLAFIDRFPKARDGWTVGDLQRLSALVLALPAYVLMRPHQADASAPLHPVLAALFRVVDGVRMTTHTMLFVPVDGSVLDPDEPMDAEELFAFAELNGVFISGDGVCAGPRAMIEEFLGVLISGNTPPGGPELKVPDAIEAVLTELDPAFDYGLLGLQAHAAGTMLWPEMMRTYESLFAIVNRHGDVASERFGRFRAFLEAKIEFLRQKSLFGIQELGQSRDRAFSDMYDRSTQALNGGAADTPLVARFEAALAEASPRLRDSLTERLQVALGLSAPAGLAVCHELAQTLEPYLRREQAIVRVAADAQAQINELLERNADMPPFAAADLNLFYLMQEAEPDFPYLDEELASLLGIGLNVTSASIDIADGLPACPCGPSPESGRHGASQSTCDGHGNQ